MPYVGSLAVAVVALLVLAGLVVALLGPLRRTTAARAEVTADLVDRVGLLRARLAALRVRRARRRA